MRSLLMVSSLCAVAMAFTGCSLTSIPCTQLSHLQGCGCGANDSCDSCRPMRIGKRLARRPSQCRGVNFGDGMPVGMESFAPAPVMPTLASTGDCGCSDCAAVAPMPQPSGGCEGSSDCGCSDCGAGGLLGRMMLCNKAGARNGEMGIRLNELGSECADAPSSGLAGGVCAAGGPILGGRVAHAGGLLAGDSMGCGKFGCGSKGKLCMSCGLRGRFGGGHGLRRGHHGLGGGHTKPYAGAIPHTAAPPTFNGGPGGGGVPQYVYPYYTTRGPRDFLLSKPPSIGY